MARFAALLLAALAFLLPLGAAADSCADCLGEASSDCCAPSCCPCCVYGPSVLTASLWGTPRPATVDMAPVPQETPHLSLDPRDIFHVPKPVRL